MASKAKTIGTQPGAAVDLETNKAVARRLIEVFNGRRLDLLVDVLHPEFGGRGISAFAPDEPEEMQVAYDLAAARKKESRIKVHRQRLEELHVY